MAFSTRCCILISTRGHFKKKAVDDSPKVVDIAELIAESANSSPL